MNYYLLILWSGVDITLLGPFADIQSRDKKAKEFRREFGEACEYFSLEATIGSKVEINPYSETFFDE